MCAVEPAGPLRTGDDPGAPRDRRAGDSPLGIDRSSPLALPPCRESEGDRTRRNVLRIRPWRPNLTPSGLVAQQAYRTAPGSAASAFVAILRVCSGMRYGGIRAYEYAAHRR